VAYFISLSHTVSPFSFSWYILLSGFYDGIDYSQVFFMDPWSGV
jgi:hypothetical protein